MGEKTEFTKQYSRKIGYLWANKQTKYEKQKLGLRNALKVNIEFVLKV